MRRMYSDGQVVKVVNKAIDDGEIVIEAGGLPKIESGDAGKALIVNADETSVEWATVGLRPKDKEKLDNSLQLPESAPAAQQLVSINKSGEQLNIDFDNKQFQVSSNSLKLVDLPYVKQGILLPKSSYSFSGLIFNKTSSTTAGVQSLCLKVVGGTSGQFSGLGFFDNATDTNIVYIPTTVYSNYTGTNPLRALYNTGYITSKIDATNIHARKLALLSDISPIIDVSTTFTSGDVLGAGEIYNPSTTTNPNVSAIRARIYQHLPILLNNKQYNFQEEDTNNYYYGNMSLSGTSIVLEVISISKSTYVGTSTVKTIA